MSVIHLHPPDEGMTGRTSWRVGTHLRQVPWWPQRLNGTLMTQLLKATNRA